MKSFRKLLTGLVAATAIFASATVNAHDCGDLVVRVRGIYLFNMDDSGDLSSSPGAWLSVKDSGTAELDFSYFFTQNIAAELILATTKHDLDGDGSLSGVKIGSTWVLPPTLTIQYHPFPCCCFQPYVGAGLNYTFFYSEDCDLADTDLSLYHSFGVAAQAGFDYLLGCGWLLNFDVKFIRLATRGRLTGSTAGSIDVDIDPLIIGLGVGKVF